MIEDEYREIASRILTVVERLLDRLDGLEQVIARLEGRPAHQRDVKGAKVH